MAGADEEILAPRHRHLPPGGAAGAASFVHHRRPGQNLGVRIRVDIRLNVQSCDALERFDAAVIAIPEVLECMTMLGGRDYSLTVVARDVDDYQRFMLGRLAKLPSIATYRSTLVVKEVKRMAELPV